MKELFQRMDKDGGGELELKEVILFMKALSDDLSDEHISMIFNNLDADASGTINFEEFMVKTINNLYKNLDKSNIVNNMFQQLFNEISVAGWKPVDNSERTEINEEEVKQLFYLIDTERTGFITPKVFEFSIF